MPIHDWTLVEAGIYHAFHHEWVTEIGRALNRGILPRKYYALPEQIAAGFGPDVLTLQDESADDEDTGGVAAATATVLRARPEATVVAESEAEIYRKKKKAIVVRHVSGDRMVAVIELVSPGNKATRNAVRAFVQKARELLERRVHLLIADLFPPGPRDPEGLHSLIWEEIDGNPIPLPPGKPLALSAFEADLPTRAYIESVAVGDPLPEMPLFLVPNGCVMVPLDATYRAAFEAQPRRWRDVLQPPAG